MRILITSGGTKAPIDPVRDITNMSKGTFGSRLAKVALEEENQVFYLASEDAVAPHSIKFEFKEGEKTFMEMTESLLKFYDFCQRTNENYVEFRFRTFQQYKEQLEMLVKTSNFDAILLAAAVSDYEVENYSDRKIKSSDELTIQLKETQKLIGLIKQWSPKTYLAGFKLLVGASDEELITAARQSIEKNGCNLVIANEWNALKAGNHKVLLVSPDQPTYEIKDNIAQSVIDRITGDVEK